MQILTVSGSTNKTGSNSKLLGSLGSLRKDFQFMNSNILDKLPLFTVELDKNPLPENVVKWRSQVETSDGVIFCTPEYLHNLPARLKNALEWLTTSGELSGKKVLAITLTPNEPRGEKAMQSLLWSLQALDARILASLPLYQNELLISAEGVIEGVSAMLLNESLSLFKE